MLKKLKFKIIWTYLLFRYKTPERILIKKLKWHPCQHEDHYNGIFFYWWDHPRRVSRDLVKDPENWILYEEEEQGMQFQFSTGFDSFVKDEIKQEYNLEKTRVKLYPWS